MVMAQKELERMTMPNRRPRKVKRISVSSKRQISIPKEFYEKLNIGDEVNLELYGNQLVIKPIHEGFEDFSEEILADLVAEGYVGSDLIAEFKNRKGKIGMAVDSLIAETIANGKPTTIDNLFGEDEDDF
ncbi:MULTISPECIES: AbrB/MazE/SpoVT family DNA-binding domain-containing protein [unclassified Bacillus (in: firmicutes)]|uniref:AbrB/MazE/SpoVT family DNA-binding domain-containing protein n=1 Tax=unclassified Bacillus (in: firmicutes) TaxID=185979 RepID=UPI002035AFA4|nr:MULTISPECIES: AbrB/MazE/SpoVT family DNA-binding domain-containing protein [unclassified Bacillus (in: firmicutes)]